MLKASSGLSSIPSICFMGSFEVYAGLGSEQGFYSSREGMVKKIATDEGRVYFQGK